MCFVGFTPLFHYKITCDENGNWFPDPSCRKVYNGGFIFQKLSNSIKCLIARWADTSTSYDWTLGFVNSSKHCIQSQKSAMYASRYLHLYIKLNISYVYFQEFSLVLIFKVYKITYNFIEKLL